MTHTNYRSITKEVYNKKPVGYWFRRWQRANKRAGEWREEAKRMRNFWVEEARRYAINSDFWRDKFKETDLKQKKAWISFYIATILYIVGIIIVI